MRKPKQKTKATQPKKPAAKPKRVKLSVEQLSDKKRSELLLHYVGKLKPLLVSEERAKKAVTQAYELAKKEGIPKKAIKLAVGFETQEGVEAVNKELDNMAWVARTMGVKLSTDLFGKPKGKAGQHFEDGRRAALKDEPARPPEHLVQRDAQAWLAGHAEGRISLNSSRGAAGFQKLGDVVDTLVPPDTANGGGETAATAH